MFNVILLGVTSLLNDLSGEMVFPILPFFITSLGGTGLAIGLIFGIGDAVASVLKVFSGEIADRTRKYKAMTIAGYAFSTVAKFGYVIFTRLPLLAAVYPVDRIGKGFRDAPRDAIVSESTPARQRGRAFGIQRAMDSTGAVLGSVVILIFYLHYGLSFHRIFLVSALVAILGLIPLLFIRVPPHLRSPIAMRVSLRALTPELRKFIGIATLFAVGTFSYAFMVLQTRTVLGNLDQHHALEMALIVYIVFNVVDALLSAPAGAVSDRIGRRPVVLAGYLSFTLVSAGFLLLSSIRMPLVPTLGIAAAAFVLYGAYKALIDASQRALVSDLSEPDIRGTALGTFQTLTGLAAIPAGLIAGVLWNTSPLYTFAFGTATSLTASVLLLAAIGRRSA